MMKYVIACVFSFGALCCAGSGTETDNPSSPIKSFSSTACKSKPPAASPQALTRESDVNGLTCVEWAQSATGTLDLKLYNWTLACTDGYESEASLSADGSLELRLFTQRCAVAACGSCVYDFHYELSNVPKDAPLSLRVGSAVCRSEPTEIRDELTLPLDSEPNGVVCRRLDAGGLFWYALKSEGCGKRDMPCGDCGGIDELSCDEGLSCFELAEGDSRCLAPCTDDDECGALERCEDGLCLAPASW